MKTKAKNDNHIFINALIGSLLFIFSIGFTVTNLPGIAMLELSKTAVAGVLAIASLSLLYTAIKKDKERLSRL